MDPGTAALRLDAIRVLIPEEEIPVGGRPIVFRELPYANAKEFANFVAGYAVPFKTSVIVDTLVAVLASTDARLYQAEAPCYRALHRTVSKYKAEDRTYRLYAALSAALSTQKLRYALGLPPSSSSSSSSSDRTLLESSWKPEAEINEEAVARALRIAEAMDRRTRNELSAEARQTAHDVGFDVDGATTYQIRTFICNMRIINKTVESLRGLGAGKRRIIDAPLASTDAQLRAALYELPRKTVLRIHRKAATNKSAGPFIDRKIPFDKVIRTLYNGRYDNQVYAPHAVHIRNVFHIYTSELMGVRVPVQRTMRALYAQGED